MASEELKQKGNKLYADGQWSDAAQTYTEAIEIDMDNVVLLSNRAAAYMKLGEHEKVGSVCFCVSFDLFVLIPESIRPKKTLNAASL